MGSRVGCSKRPPARPQRAWTLRFHPLQWRSNEYPVREEDTGYPLHGLVQWVVRTPLEGSFSSLLVVTLGVSRELALLDFFFITPERLERVSLEVGVGLHKLWHEVIEEAEEVIEHEHLSVAVRAGPDADGGNRQ